MSKIEMRRVNCNIPKDLYKLILDSGFENDRSFTAELITVLQGIYQNGSKPVQEDPVKVKAVSTSMDKYMQYLAMSLEERIDKHMTESREEHAKYQPGEVFDEEGHLTRWTAKIEHEMEEEVAQCVA